MKWNIVLLATAILILLAKVGTEIAVPPIAAEALAEAIAPRLAVSESRLRKELTDELYDVAGRKIAIEGGWLCFLTGLLAVRLIVDWRKLRNLRETQD